MSIIYTQGGTASIADATTTTAGKVRLATIAEAGGNSELIAVTPAGLQAEISGLTSGLTYRGLIDVSAFATTLINAVLGDYYKIDTGGTAGDGRVYDSGDAIIINADMGGVYSDAKLDKIDNVDPATSDDLTSDHTGVNYVGANTDTITTHLSGIDSAIGLLAPLASPALSGVPTAPTATQGNNSTQLATTAYVDTAVSGAGATDLDGLADVTITNASVGEVLRYDGSNWVDAQLSYNDLSNTPTLPSSSDDLTSDHTGVNYVGANTDTVTTHLSGIDSAVGLLAPLASPALSGVPTAPTATQGNNSTQLATTAYVDTAVSGAGATDLDGLADVTITNASVGEVLRYDGSSWVDAQLSYNDLSNTPTLPSSSDDLTSDHTGVNYVGANTDTLTTHLSGIDSAIGLLAPLASPALTGAPTAPTANQGDNSTQLATTAYVDTAVSGAGGGSDHDPSLVLVSSASYDMQSLLSGGGLTATQIKNLHVWYSGTGSNFTVTLPDIATVGAGITSVGGNPADTFEIYVGRGYAGTITLSSTEGIDATGDGSVSFTPTSFTLNGGQFLKVIAWRSTTNNAQYIVESGAVTDIGDLADVTITSAGVGEVLRYDGSSWVDAQLSYNDLSNTPTLPSSSDDLTSDHVGVNYTGANTDTITTHLSGIDSAIGLLAPLASPALTGAPTAPTATQGNNSTQIATTAYVDTAVSGAGGGGGFTYSAVSTATTAQAQYHYSVTGTTTITLPASSGITAGQEVRVKNMGTNTVTIARTGTTDTIDGQTSIAMAVQYQALHFVSNGSNGWEII